MRVGFGTLKINVPNETISHLQYSIWACVTFSRIQAVIKMK